jgi:hypothetical protein
VEKVINHLSPRICIELPTALHHLDENASREWMPSLVSLNSAYSLLNKDIHSRYWHQAIQQIASKKSINNLLAGTCTRLLFDKSLLSVPETADRLRFALSYGSNPSAAAQWMEGFLQGSGLLLLYHQELWNIINSWLDELDEGLFRQVLPVLRKTFSRFQAAERSKMLQLAMGQGATLPEYNTPDFDEERAGIVGVALRLVMAEAHPSQ